MLSCRKLCTESMRDGVVVEDESISDIRFC